MGYSSHPGPFSFPSQAIEAPSQPALGLPGSCLQKPGICAPPRPQWSLGQRGVRDLMSRAWVSNMTSESPGSRVPVLKGLDEWGFHRAPRGGNKSQGRRAAAGFQRRLAVISLSVWPVGRVHTPPSRLWGQALLLGTWHAVLGVGCSCRTWLQALGLGEGEVCGLGTVGAHTGSQPPVQGWAECT